jgi:endoglycosylceramidase
MKIGLAICIVFLTVTCSLAQVKYGMRDEQGRHEIARGFVVTTNDGLGEVFYHSDDYQRMVRMGANYQVIRLEMGKLKPATDESIAFNYLSKVDSLVNLGKQNGIKSVFKMTLYGMNDFSWEKLLLNKNKEQKNYVKAWARVWNKFSPEPYVIGYDLVNEPRKEGWDIAYQDMSNKYLIPFYRYLIDEAAKVNPSKKFFIQDIFMNKGDSEEKNQYAELKTSVNRKNVVFSPHIYEAKKPQIDANMKRFSKEADLQDAPIFVGEWGVPTFDKTDSTLTEQLEYIDFYAHTVSIFDSLGVGSIKAWFNGNRTKQHFLGSPSTWSIFADEEAVGTVERKYITDIIARPYPQLIAGDILNFKFDFPTRSLKALFKADNSKGASKIFIGANRHYPDGFSVIINNDFVMVHNPLKTAGLEVVKSSVNDNPSDFIWDEGKQELVVLKWPWDKQIVNFKIVPGIIIK